jgi:hypothetical protein
MTDRFPAETAHLGSFDPLEAPIVIELLAEHGIVAYSKAPLDQPEGQPYGSIFGDSGRGRLFVDASQLPEAQRIVAQELPGRVEEMRRALEEGWANEEMLAEPDRPINGEG